MSLRWIHENLEPPTCDEECSDIDDSCSDDSYDSDLLPDGNGSNNNYDDQNHNHRRDAANGTERSKRETRRHPTTTVTIDENGKPHYETEKPEKLSPPALIEDLCLHNNQASNNPTYCQFQKLKLFCRTGYFIGITPSGRVKGFSSDSTNDAHVRLIVCPVSSGIVRLQSAETKHYLAFNATGHLYGERRANKSNTEWEQWNIGNYDAFRSHKYAEPGWWLGIKRNGRHKPGPRTAWGQKAVQFLAVRLA